MKTKKILVEVVATAMIVAPLAQPARVFNVHALDTTPVVQTTTESPVLQNATVLIPSDATVGQVLLGYVLYHIVAGLILALVFQPAHVIEHTLYPLPNENRVVEKNWFAHQMLTSANYSEQNKLLTWYVGGLNYQIEHHLFLEVPARRYRKMAPKVQAVCEKYGLNYNNASLFKQYGQVLGRIVKYAFPFKK